MNNKTFSTPGLTNHIILNSQKSLKRLSNNPSKALLDQSRLKYLDNDKLRNTSQSHSKLLQQKIDQIRLRLKSDHLKKQNSSFKLDAIKQMRSKDQNIYQNKSTLSNLIKQVSLQKKLQKDLQQQIEYTKRRFQNQKKTDFQMQLEILKNQSIQQKNNHKSKSPVLYRQSNSNSVLYFTHNDIKSQIRNLKNQLPKNQIQKNRVLINQKSHRNIKWREQYNFNQEEIRYTERKKQQEQSLHNYKLVDRENRIKKLETEEKRLKDENYQLKNQLNLCKNQLQLLRSKKSDFASYNKISQLERQRLDSRQEINFLKKNLENIKNQLQNLRMKEKYDTNQTKILINDLQQKKVINHELYMVNSTLKQKLKEVEKQYKQLIQNYKSIFNQNNNLLDQINGIKNENQNIELIYQTKIQQCEKQKIILQEKYQNNINQFKQKESLKFLHVSQELSKSLQEISKLENTNKQLLQQIQQKELKISELLQKSENSKNIQEKNELLIKENQLNKLKYENQIQKLQYEIQIQREDKTILKKVQSLVNQKVEILQGEVKELEKLNKDIQLQQDEQKSKRNQEFKKLQQNIQETQELVQNLNNQIYTLTKNNEELVQINEKLVEELKTLSLFIKQSQQKLKQKHNGQMNLLLQKMNEQKKQIDIKIQQYQSQIQSLKLQLSKKIDLPIQESQQQLVKQIIQNQQIVNI